MVNWNILMSSSIYLTIFQGHCTNKGLHLLIGIVLNIFATAPHVYEGSSDVFTLNDDFDFSRISLLVVRFNLISNICLQFWQFYSSSKISTREVSCYLYFEIRESNGRTNRNMHLMLLEKILFIWYLIIKW